MLVCSCNVISSQEIEAVIREMLDHDCWQLIVPGHVYHAMEKRGRCCGCFPNVLEIIIKVTKEYHLTHAIDEAKTLVYLERVRALHSKYRRIGNHERSRKGHRAA